MLGVLSSDPKGLAYVFKIGLVGVQISDLCAE